MNLLIRAASAVVLAPVVLYCIWRGDLWLLGLLLIALVIGLHEALGLLLQNPFERRIQGLLGAAMLGALTVSMMADAPAWQPLAAMALWLCISGLCFVVRPLPIESVGGRWAASIFAPIYVGLPLLCLGALRGHPDGVAWLVLAMAGTWLNDTFAYAAGRLFGRHKMHPTVSPKKTWEGFAGGVVGSVAAAFAVRHFMLPELAVHHALLFAAVLGVLVPAGDLAESLLKRAAGAKDSGNVIPGHGGLLDRVDSLLFAAPWTLLCAHVLGAG
jgi:phosphatidate cytidylyltransferase